MTPSRFRLERIYQLRIKQAQFEANQTREAHRRRQGAQNALQDGYQQRKKRRDDLVASKEQGCPAGELRRHWAHQVRLERQCHALKEDYDQKAVEVEECQARLLVARQREQMLETLKRRHQARWRVIERRQQQKQVDEIAGFQYVKQRGGEEYGWINDSQC